MKELEQRLELKEADNLRFQRELADLETKLKTVHDQPDQSKLENEQRISWNRKTVIDTIIEANVFSAEWRRKACEALKSLEDMELGPTQNGKLEGFRLRIGTAADKSKVVQIGQFKNGKLEGAGIELVDDGSMFVGQFKGGSRLKCVWHSENGTMYFGANA